MHERYRVPKELSNDTKVLIIMWEIMEYMKDIPFSYRDMNMQDFWNYLQMQLSEKTQKDI